MLKSYHTRDAVGGLSCMEVWMIISCQKFEFAASYIVDTMTAPMCRTETRGDIPKYWCHGCCNRNVFAFTRFRFDSSERDLCDECVKRHCTPVPCPIFYFETPDDSAEIYSVEGYNYCTAVWSSVVNLLKLEKIWFCFSRLMACPLYRLESRSGSQIFICHGGCKASVLAFTRFYTGVNCDLCDGCVKRLYIPALSMLFYFETQDCDAEIYSAEGYRHVHTMLLYNNLGSKLIKIWFCFCLQNKCLLGNGRSAMPCRN